MSVVHHVLGKFDQDDYATILLAIDKSEEALRFYLKEGQFEKNNATIQWINIRHWLIYFNRIMISENGNKTSKKEVALFY